MQFFFGWCYSYGPQQGPDRQQKKRRREGSSRGESKRKLLKEINPEPKKGNQEKEKNPSRVQSCLVWITKASSLAWLLNL
jgi:hypothetical protein